MRDMTSAAKIIQCCVALNNFIIEKDCESLDMDDSQQVEVEQCYIPDWDVIPDTYRNGRVRRTPTREKLLARYF